MQDFSAPLDFGTVAEGAAANRKAEISCGYASSWKRPDGHAGSDVTGSESCIPSVLSGGGPES